MSELEVAIAQVFRKKGKTSMTENDFVFAVSLDFRWLTPKEAQKLLEMGLDSDLLKLEGGTVKPNFDYKAVDVPKGYSPGPELLQADAKPKGMLMKMVDDIANATALPAKDIISRVNITQDRMGVDAEVAGLIVGNDLGVDMSHYLDAVEEEVGKRYKLSTL